MNAHEIQAWLIARIADTLRLKPSDIDVHKPFDSYGMSSTEAVILSGDLEELLGSKLSPTLIYDYPSIAVLSSFLALVPGAKESSSFNCPSVDSQRSIAIIGIGCRFPGANDPPSFWRLLRDGQDMITEVPLNRWDARAFFHSDESIPGKAVTRWGGFLEDVDRFDPFFFGISPGEAERMDPQQRLLMELAYESFEDAGYPMKRIRGSHTGVFVGISINEYGFLQQGEYEHINSHSGTGNALSIAANRLSYFFDLHGPSMIVDTACSSSLMALHLACRSIRTGECEMAVAGGVNVILSPALSIAFTKSGVLARDGRCKAFDARADGYVRGEGGGLVVLKPLSSAIADGDGIYAVIRGSAVHQDGRTNGLMAPSQKAQESVLRAAISDAGVSPRSIQYVEAHGTGTLLGDSIEASALGSVFSSDRLRMPCLLGSVKSNFGHLEAAAGIAGLIKVGLSLKHRALPPSLHYLTPNPHVSFANLGLRVQDKLTPWPEHSGPAMAGVSSFGFGGTNVHVVLEEAPEQSTEKQACDEPSSSGMSYILPISAQSPEALDSFALLYRNLLSNLEFVETTTLQDLCSAASTLRNHLDYRTALVAHSTEGMVACLDDFLSRENSPDILIGQEYGDDRRRCVFVFSGQGSQRNGMTRELLKHEPVFRSTIEKCERAMQQHVEWSLFEQLSADGDESRYCEIDIIQPVLFAIQVGLANLWRSWGIVPDVVVGHSMGEVAAAHVAGALGLEDAARVICARSRVLKQLSGRGGMVVVGLSSDDMVCYLSGNENNLAIAAKNSPRSTVVSGDELELTNLISKLEESDIFCRRVSVDVASHSPQTFPLRDELNRSLKGIQPQPTILPFISAVTGAACEGLFLDTDYWVRNVLEPVDFVATIQLLLEQGHNTFIEISPHPILSTSVQQGMIHFGKEGKVIPSLMHNEGERSSMLRALGALYTYGHSIDWKRIYPSSIPRVSLPTYPWQRERYWMNMEGTGAQLSIGSDDGSGQSRHPLLGSRVSPAQSPGTHFWQADIDRSSASFLRDHRVGGEVIVPASAMIEMALAAAAASQIEDSHNLGNVEFCQNFNLPSNQPQKIQVTLIPEPENIVSFSVFGKPADSDQDDWTLYAKAKFIPGGADTKRVSIDAVSPEKFSQDFTREVSPDELYLALKKRGLDYGPTMRGIKAVWQRYGEALGFICISDLVIHEFDSYQIHPTLLDNAIQVLAAVPALSSGEIEAGVTYVPIGCDRVRLYNRPSHTVWSHVVLQSDTAPNASIIMADIRLFDETGRILAELSGFSLARIEGERLSAHERNTATWQYGIQWQEAAWPATHSTDELSLEEGNNWIIMADHNGLAEALKLELEAHSQRCHLIEYDDTLLDLRNRDNTIPNEHDVSLQKLIDEKFLAEQLPFYGVIHLWCTDIEPSLPSSQASLGMAQELSCNSILNLAQYLTGHGGFGMPRLWVVTCGAQPVVNGEPISVAQSLAWGLGKSIAFELPELKSTLVDLDPSFDPSKAAKVIFRQLCVNDTEREVAFRGNRRLVPRLVPHPQPVKAITPFTLGSYQFRKNRTYLITGGLGGLGLTVSKWMIEQGAKYLVLVGRSAPTLLADRTIDEMRKHGTEVQVMNADITDYGQVAEIFERVRKDMPSLAGIVHAAGVLDNAPIVDLDAGRLSNVLAPKVDGTWNLHMATAQENLDFFVFFSSAVSVLGSPGQGNYAAANSFLDAMAHYRRRQGLPAISINWGPWAEIGLAVAGNFVDNTEKSGSLGIKGITPEHGLEALSQALVGDRTQLTILPFDLRSLLELYPTAAQNPFFSKVGGKDTHVSHLYTRPNLRQAYVEPRTEIELQLAQLWMQTLRIDRVGIKDSFFELGGDSVLAAQIVTSGHRIFGVEIDLREAFEAFTIEGLARIVESALKIKIDNLSESEAQRFLDEL